jgi:isoleucyl-tRNA synthetase
MYKPLADKFTYPGLENDVLKFWDDKKVFEQTLEERKDSPYFTFYEGPPTVNGKPGIHHMMARTIKDSICRYKTMQGFYVRRQAGWDTHGLPVEIQVEKELGIKNKQELEEFGIEKFNKACRDLVYKNIEMSEGWKWLTKRMGYWVNLDEAYITCTNEYIESVWWALSQYFKKDLIYRGFKVVPQSPTIETPLSSHELSLGYKDVRDPSCFIKPKITDSPVNDIIGSRFLVWTTTPWTLFGNVALAVGEKIDYVHVKNTRKIKDEEQVDLIVMAEALLHTLDGEYEIIGKYKGSELIGSRYEQLLPYAKIDLEEHPKGLSVIGGDFVSTENGSGIVHLAPAFGEDDYRMSLEHNLPFLQPVTPNGHMTEDMGEFAGRAIKNFTYDDNHSEEGVDKDVVIWLKYNDKIYRSTNDYLHSYPHCWRTGNPIMYYARDSWFIRSSQYKESLVGLNKTINWQPPEIGAGRFGNWLEDVKDWSLSRDRFWGTPLPIWVNENDKEDFFCIGSIEELRAGHYEDENGHLTHMEEITDVDLHRPFVDNVIFKRDGKTYRRTHEVIDVWFDSGSMPFAQMHYPFENKELFEKSFPADFIAEGIDQTRGWFYTLHNIATAIFDRPAYKNIVVNELILDKKGVKMSKKLGNTVDPFKIMEEIGADAVRWYLFVNNPPWKTTLFNQEDMARTVISDFFRSLTNTYAFFTLYANIDGFDGTEKKIPVSERAEIDRWILSRINSVLKEFTDFMNAYELTKAHRLLQEFVRNELSNWYIRRNRRRFWKGEKDEDKISAYQTLRNVMMNVISMMAPTAPFLAEDLFQRLRSEDDPISIHTSLLPKYDEKLIDEDLERRMDKAQRIVFLARSLREKSKIRGRQPLKRILVPVLSSQEKEDVNSISDIVVEEINVKAIEFISDETSDVIVKKIKPDFKALGKKHGKQTNNIAQKIRGFGVEEISIIESGNPVILDIDGNNVEVISEDVEIYSEDIEGWSVASERGVTIALDTEITKELEQEGFAREFVNRIQNLRKEHGYEVTDRINIIANASAVGIESLKAMKDYIKGETLCDIMEFTDDNLHGGKHLDLESEKVLVNIRKI